MEMTQTGYESVVGVDVSKAKLDIAWGRNGTVDVIANAKIAIKDLIKKYNVCEYSVLVVVEATGGYESLLVDCLHETNIAVAVVNPRRVREFAKDVGWDAKTDPIDAKVIAWYGEVVMPNPSVAKTKAEKEPTALVVRRRQLLKMINMEKNRLAQASAGANTFIKDTLKSLQKQVKTLDGLIATGVQEDTRSKDKVEIMQSVKGLGPGRHQHLHY